MVRKGREFEEIISRLEEVLNDSDIEITSPGWVKDNTNPTGKKREIDIALKRTVGEKTSLIILECRDRKDNENVTWIEQLVTKRNDIGADKAIAVSSTGFTEGAKNKAKYHGVELRTLEEITREIIFDWFKPEFALQKILHCRITNHHFSPSDQKKRKRLKYRLNALLNKSSLDTPILLLPGSHEPISINELFHHIKNLDQISAQFSSPSEIRKFTITFVPEELGSVYEVPLDDKTSIKIDKILVDANIQLEVKEIPFESIKEYKGNGQTICHTMDINLSSGTGDNQSLRWTFTPEDGCRRVTIQSINNSTKK